MKRTLFLAYILAALLACSAVQQTRAEDYVGDDYGLNPDMWDIYLDGGWLGGKVLSITPASQPTPWMTCEQNVNVTYNGNVITYGTFGGTILVWDYSDLTLKQVTMTPSARVFLLDASTLMLNGETTKLNLITLSNSFVEDDSENVVTDGTLAGSVTIEPNSRLRLEVNMDPNATVTMKGNSSLNLNGGYLNFGLTVTRKGNELKNGAFVGTLTLEKDSSLAVNNSLVSWGGPTSIVLNDGSTLEMTGSDPWINRLPALQVNGSATINGAFLRVRSAITPDWEYTLTDGVANLKGSGTYYVLTGDDGKDYFNLAGHTTNFGIIVWESVDPADILISNGKINKHVDIHDTSTARKYCELNLKNVEIQSGASFSIGAGASLVLQDGTTVAEGVAFSMRDKSKLDLGGSATTVWLNIASGATATVSNGRIGMQGGTQDYWAYYTLGSQEGKPTITGNGYTLKLEKNVTLVTNKVTCFLVDGNAIGNSSSNPVNINVITDGRFILGRPPKDIGGQTQLVMGDVTITKTGTGSQDANKDVDIYCQLVGNLRVEAKNGRVNAGIIGQQVDKVNDTTSTGYVEANQIYLSGFLGKSLTLKAANNGGSAIQVTANALAAESLLFEAKVNNVYGDISFKGNLSGKNITMEGKAIDGAEVSDENINYAGYVEFGDCDITATGAITIKEGFKGLAGQSTSNLTMNAGGKVTLRAVGAADARVSRASIVSSGGSVEMSSFSGGALKVSTPRALAISGSVEADGVDEWSPAGSSDKYAVVLEGAGVSVGSLTAAKGSSYVRSTGNDQNILIERTLSAGATSTLVSAGGISVSDNVLGGNLKATAGSFITLANIGTDGHAVGDAELTAGGSITATSFTGATLKASAGNAGTVTINGSVAASGGSSDKYAVLLEGGSISINSLAAAHGSSYVHSTAKNITIDGTLKALGTTTLDAMLRITGAESCVLGGNLTAKSGSSMDLGIIGTAQNAVGDAVLTSGGYLKAGSFTGATLKAAANATLTISGGVAASGGDIWNPAGSSDKYSVVLEGGSVNIYSLAAAGGSAYVHSNGNLTIGGTTLSAAVTTRLDAGANITGSATDVLGGNLTATAGTSITLANIGTAKQPAGNVALEAGRDITASSFTGATLKASAGNTGAVTISGSVAATGGDIWSPAGSSDKYSVVLEGGSVNIYSLAAAGSAYIHSTAGNLTIDGTLNAKDTTLDSAANITVSGNVSGGNLTATAGGSIKLGAFATGNLTATAGGSIELGAFTAGNLTATAGASITLANIGTAEQPAGNVALEARGDITATSSVNADTLTVSAAGNVAMKDVTVGQEGASIVSTDGTAIAVNLETFTGEKAQIKAENGAIQIGAVKGANNTLQAAGTLQVKTAVSGSGHTFLAGAGVTFDDNPSTNGLSNATVRAPEVKWAKGTTLSNVTVTGAKETDVTKVTVGGALTLNYSHVQGDVTIDVSNAKVTVDNSTVDGTVSGSTYTIGDPTDTRPIELELNNGAIGGVGKLAGLTSAGTSSITGLTGDLVTPTLTLNGESLTLSRQQAESGSTPSPLLAAVSTLKVTKSSQLYSNLELNDTATLDFYLSAENTTTPLLTIYEELTSGAMLFPYLTINLTGDASVEGGNSYALISVKSGETPDFWNYTILTVNGLGAKEGNLSWKNGVLYYQNGTALETAVWTPGENHLWNTVDQNWTQDGHRYRYKDGVDVVFNDTGKGGDVQLEGEFAPKDVQVEGTCDYTFKGTGKITGATALTKNGSGTLTIENANTYSGGTTINAGTLVVANAQALGTGTVTLTGGTVQIANGAKSFNLVVTGQDTHLVGSGTNAFTGSLTLEEGSKLSADGGALSSANGMEKIVMKSGSSLAMTQIDGLNNRIWINRVSEFTVEGEATLADVFLYLDPDGEYTLGAMTGDNVNSLQNLRGTGVTAYCLDGSTLDLNDNITNLNIIAWKQDSSNASRVKNGTLNTDLYIYRNSSLHLENAIIGRNATFEMCEGAYLNMGGYDVRAQMSRFSFDVDGSGATIDNGTIIVDQAETDRLVTLCRGFLKGSFSVSLVEGTVLDLDRNTLYIASTGLEGTSASIGNGTINGRINVGSGQTLRLLNHLDGTGTVYLGDNARLNLCGHNLNKDVDMTGSTSIDRGCLTKTVTLCGGTLDLGGTLYVYGMNLQSDHAVALNGQTLQVDHMQLAGHTLTLDGAGTLDALEAFTGGAIAKTGEGRLNIQGPVQLTGLDVQGGDTTVTGTEETKISIDSLKAAAGSTIELVHTNATAANEALAYKGNLVIGNGSTVTAGGTDGWAYGTDNSLTIQKGGKLDLGNYRWSFAPGNKVTLAGGEIAGSGSDAHGAIDFCGGDNVVAVTEDSTLSARMRVRGSVAFDVGEGKELSFTGGIVSSGAYDDDKGTVSKTGAGTMVMSGANALCEGGAVNVQAGTLKVTGNSNPLGAAAVNVSGGSTLELGGTLAPTGVVNLKGGTLKLSEGRKNFALTVTGTDNRMEGDWNNAFTGAVTLEENSRLVSAGSMASWDGPREIVMKDGSTLEMDTHMDIWINDITNLTVEGEATMVNAFLRINPYTNGGVYTLDNGVENLKGEGVTAYCLDGSTFNLNGNATNLGIIVWNAQPNKDNTVKGGLVDTKVDIHQDSRLILSDVEIGNNATFFMGDGAYLDMGGGYTKKARLSAFSFAGASVTIDNGKLLVADGESVQLNTELLGTATISLGMEANLDLNGHTLAGSKIELADASATVSGGQFSGDVTVKSGKTLRLGVDQSIAGGVKLEKSTSTLSLGSDCSVEGAISGSGTIMKEGIGTAALSGSSLQSFTGSLEVQGGILNLLNAASVNVQDVTIQYGSLGVYSGESTDEAGEATLTIKDSKSLAAGPDAKLNANLVMEGGSTLDVRYTNGAGLLMGSTVTLSTGMTLEGYGSDWATWKDGTKYVLFTGVDGLDIGGGMMTGTLDYTQWVDAKEYFTNIEESNRYFLCYGGAPAQNAQGILTAVNDGSNVGMVYIMTMPEPTTSTLSLLALAALAARRRRH